MLSALVTAGVVSVFAWLVWLSRDVENRVGAARPLGAAVLVALAAWLALVILYAPIEQVQGVVQKISYAHFACIIPMYLGFVLTAVGGVGFLRTRDGRWDQLAIAGAEVGVVFCTLMLVVGPIWAKPVWGHWWVWDLRLTLTLVLWFVYVAYLFLRGLAFGSDAAKTFTSVYGIAGTAVIPFVYYAVKIARGSTMHPDQPTMPAEMAQTSVAGMLAFLALFAWLVARRMEVGTLEARALGAGARGSA